MYKRQVWERVRELVELKEKLRDREEYRRLIEEKFYPVFQDYPLDSEEAKDFHRIYLDASMEGLIIYEREGFASRIFDDVKRRLKEMGARRIEVPGGGYYWVLGK